MPADRCEALLRALEEEGTPCAAIIGEVCAPGEGEVAGDLRVG